MTSAFQTVIDNAETISINKKKKVSQTVSREGVVKSISLGGQVWEFQVKLPDGPRWSEYRPLIEKIEALDRVTTGTIAINKAAHSWITGYQGDLANTGSVTVSYSDTTPTTLTITGGASGLSAGQYRFKSGDVIQLGAGGVYTVVDDVAYNGTTITTHRPVRDTSGTYTLKVGQAVEWTVICTQLPQWTIFARDQISWEGPFVFSEAI